ncbi:hypothetical protein B0H16DRAFT_1724143 [Mycena metata]|uniref:HNH nuclease domain-containing protein n=1 Tax=Mycena metata TaxID=1033252 RepID=A0AAD7IWV5_9AGAR|nr:hypothetical protein B0H16DRAFT_1724143 [Mycena metata]
MSNNVLLNAFGEDQDGAFDDDEDGQDARESQSSSDDLASRNGGDLETPSVTFSNPYQTPETRSTAGSVAHRAQEKLATLCGGRKCVVTHEIAPHPCIEVARLLPRATRGSVLSKLEFAFGLRYRQMHIDTMGNLEHIIVHLHRSFDHAGWFLLPPSDALDRIRTFMSTPGERRSYKEVFSATEKFKYRLVPLRLIEDNIGIWRRKSSSLTPNLSNHPFPPKPVYEQIYPIGLDGPAADLRSLPIVESRANPFFVVANAGPKITDNLSLLPVPWTFHRDIVTLTSIWTFWMSTEPPQEWRAAPYSRERHNGGGESGSPGQPGDGSPVPRRRQPTRAASSSAGVPTGHGLAHGAADLPELDHDRRAASTESDDLTQDAVRLVASLDRAEFIQKWLQEPAHGDPIARRSHFK